MAKKKKSKSIKVDFTGVESRVGSIPAGEYVVKVVKVESTESSNDNDMLKWHVEISEGKFKGKKLIFNTVLIPEALWNLRNLLEAMGVDVPDDELDIDLEEMEGQQFVAHVEDREYQGKTRSDVVGYSSVENHEEVETDEEDEEEEPKKKKRAPVEDEDDEDDEKPKKSKKKASDDEDEDEDEEVETEDDDEEEDEAPKKKKKKASDDEDEESSLTADEVEDMSSDELKDLIKKYKLKVDLSEFKSSRRKRNAVISALEDKGILGE